MMLRDCSSNAVSRSLATSGKLSALVVPSMISSGDWAPSFSG